MHDIKVNVKGDGTLLHQETTIRLGTTKEKKRARLFFSLWMTLLKKVSIMLNSNMIEQPILKDVILI